MLVLEGPLFCHPFCGLPITDSRVIQPGGHQQIWILFLPDVVVRGVRSDVVEILRLIRLPHSSYSVTVSGRLGSDIVLRTSTKGTKATTVVNKSGRIFITAPMRSPPALPPEIATFAAEQYLCAMRNSVQRIKSVNEFFLFSNFPSSYQVRPSSPPPLMCAMA